MNDVIFEQDKEPQRPYTAKVLLNRARNPRLCLSQPKVNPGSWLGNLLRKQRMSREQIIEKVAGDLWLTLEKRDGIFVFRFPDVWDAEDVQDMQRRVLEGIAMLEAQRNLIVWLRDLFGNIVAGMARLWESMIAPIAMAIFGFALLLGTIYAFSVGSTGWSIALFLVALLCCSVKISVSCTDRAEPDLENAFPLGGSHVKRIVPSSEKLNAQLPAPQRDIASVMELINLLSCIKALKEEARIARQNKAEQTDEIYEEPQATYPMEMKL